MFSSVINMRIEAIFSEWIERACGIAIATKYLPE